MNSVACFTSFNRAYLSRARTLSETLKRQHPEIDCFALYVDEHPGQDESAIIGQYFESVVLAKDIGIENFRTWIFGHDVIEACTAVKGSFCSYLQRMGYKKIIYLDPDIAVFNSLASVLSRLDTDAILLTPHQLTPDELPSKVLDNEVCSLRTGTYNLGFLALNAVQPDAIKFIDWWAARLISFCRDDRELGLFTDQKWCDLVPAFFDNYGVLRDPGCNVASWNLSQRRIEISNEGIFVNGSVLRFFHFSKVGAVGRVMLEKNSKTPVAALELALWYDRRLVANAAPESEGAWAYSAFDDGTPVDKRVRDLYRTRDDLRAAFPDPFRTGSNTYREWLAANEGV